MKKKILLVLSIVAVLACLFAITVSAETALKPQDTNAYGELSFFDESISVGRTNAKYGFTPYIDAEGTTYARVVIGDGTTFYTFPTAYILSENTIYGESQINTYVRDMTSLNNAMATATGTNPGWNADNIYRIELPQSVTRFNGGDSQGFQGYDNVIEIRLLPNSHVKDQNKTMMFWKCYKLQVIHNLDTFTFRKGCLSGAFQECKSLTDLKIGYSPEVTDTGTNVFNGCTALQSVNLFEAFPNLTSIGNFTFSGCAALKTIYSANLKQEGAIMIPEGVTSIGQEAFYNCDNIKYLSLPSTITYLGPSIIRDSSGLEFVDFNENANAINLDNWGHFSGCSGLKAVSLPDGIEIINNRFMVSCSNLQAVYLPANLKQMNTNGNGQGPFCYSSKMYFVQEPFEVRDANGYFLGDSFKMPSKPEIYYMPKNLATAGGNASSGTWFRDCIGLNTTIVMPEAFTNSTVVQMFRETANASNIKNVVYLGDMETIAWSERNHHINFIFANSKDTDISSVTFSSFYNNLNNDCYFYFCSTGFRYTMAKASAAEVATTKEENSYCHIHNPKADKTIDATCTENEKAKTFCFCGAEMNVVEKENTALGHDDKDAVVIMYFADNNYFENATSEYTCKRCEEAIKSEIANSALFTKKGITVPENEKTTSICHAITVNNKAIEDYNAYLGESNAIKYGVVVGKATASGKPVNTDGTSSQNAIVVGFEGTDYSHIQAKITNIPDENTGLYCSAYVIDAGVVTYLYEGSASTTAQVISLSNYNPTLPETTVPSNDEE